MIKSLQWFGKYNIKADRAVSYNFDKYGSTQVRSARWTADH
ncbi:structural protein [Salmonella phage 37]|uniref:Structural protein n=1 Tax=Salmonella phage 37 TaxID=1654890 RepID=A0A0N7CFE4_9CAUD|nr:structural protein [Salmonella phage 37]AKJ73963.1 structural protein [Salmonella phage 37]